MRFRKGFCFLLFAAALAGAAGRAFGGEAPEAAGGAYEYEAAPDQPQRLTVTASRIPTPVENVAEPITVFTASQPGSAATGAAGGYSAGDIEARQYRSLLDVMRQTPGVSFYTYGGEGAASTVYFRGMQAGNTRVMVDGMPMNDPSSTDGGFDFGWSGGLLDNIGQLEILRGAQSTLYGSSATGGVVNAGSRRGEGPATGFASVETGSRGTLRTRFGSSAGTDRVDYSFAGTLYHTDGISRADRRNGNSEKDAFEYGSFNLRLGVNPTSCLRFDLFANGFKGETEFDDSQPAPPYAMADSLLKTKMERFMIRPQATLSLFGGVWEQKAGYGYMRTRRRNIDDNNPAGLDYNRNKYVGELFRFDYQSILRLHESNTLLAGVDVEEESMEKIEPWYGPLNDFGRTEPTRLKPGGVTTTSVYLEDQVNLRDVFFATAGLRYVDHETYGDQLTWKTSAMLALPTRTRLKASAGTGFKAPTLYQLYDNSWGGANPDLKAEKTLGWDAGFEQAFFCDDRLVIGSTFFRNRVKDGIIPDPAAAWPAPAKNINISEYKTWGVESFLNLRLTDSIRFSAQHTWLRTEDSKGNELAQRPKNTVSANIDVDIRDRGTVTLGVVHVGARWQDNARNRKMPSYTTARIAASWKLNDHLEAFGRVENLLNRKYQQYHEFGTEGISFFGGLTASF